MVLAMPRERLLIGANGRLGRRLLERLAASPAGAVRALVRSRTAAEVLGAARRAAGRRS